MPQSSATVAARAPKTNPGSADTRQRLIEAAATLFADRGFENVTVREICKTSSANVAAVNYHFGDKAGLYRAVVMHAIRVMQDGNEQSQRAGAGQSPEEQIRSFVRVFVGRLTGDNPHAWIYRLMAREMQTPTEALDLVMTQVIQPRMDYLSTIVGAIMSLPPGDARVKRSVASLHTQCLLATRRIPEAIEKTFGASMRDLDVAVAHITDFSLGGMRAVAAAK